MITVMTLKDFQLMQLQSQQTLLEICNSLPTTNARKSCVYSLALKVDDCLPPEAKQVAFTRCLCIMDICDVCAKKDFVYS